jgi:nitroreductase
MVATHHYRNDRDTAAVLRAGLVAATAAPSIHNSQPWLFRLRDDGVDVLVDWRRQLHAVDADGREMHLSVGAALFNLRVCLGAQGYEVAVDLAPRWSDDAIAARVTLGGPLAVNPAARALNDAISRRHTNRRPFAPMPVPDRVLTELSTAAELEGGVLRPADDPLYTAVLSLIRTADNRLRADAAYQAELAAWTTPPGIGRRDGVPRSAFGPRDTDGALPLRDLSIGHGAPVAVVEFEAEPTIALLYTRADTRQDWLRAGAALQRVWLTATIRGLALTPLTQATEIPQLRRLLKDPTVGVAQSVLRLGYPLSPAGPSPRRPLADVIVG